MTWSRSAVLTAYRTCLRKGRKLKFTDKDYYFYRIKKEFRNGKDVTDIKEKEFRLEKAKEFIRKDAIV